MQTMQWRQRDIDELNCPTLQLYNILPLNARISVKF